MKKPPPHPKRRGLSKEDEALWEHTASTLKPLKARKSRHVAPSAEGEPAEPEPKHRPPSSPSKSPAQSAPPPKPLPPKPPAPPAPPALSAFDRKAARKLRQGQIEIEARIDLHGMRQHEAHSALRRFLMSAFAKGQRWVLVITGKGGPTRRQEDDFSLSGPERGVLRRNVPQWLAEPELRAIVVSYTAAAIPHGGDGALYIQLRNPEKKR